MNSENKLLARKLIVTFAFLIIFTIALIVFYNHQEKFTVTYVYITQHNFIEGISDQAIIYNNVNSQICTVKKSDKKTIVLRLDDVKAFQYEDITKKITNDVLSRDMSITFALIPKDLNRDLKFLYWINKVKKDPKVEIALHGYLHESREFAELSEEDAYNKLIKGKQILKETINIVPITFIPPENEYSSGTEAALQEAGFKIVSATENEYKEDEDFVYLGYNSQTYEFDDKKFVPAEEVIKRCNSIFEKQDVCVIMIHPQDFLEPTDHSINLEKYQELTKTLDAIKQMSNVESKRFSDVIECNTVSI